MVHVSSTSVLSWVSLFLLPTPSFYLPASSTLLLPAQLLDIRCLLQPITSETISDTILGCPGHVRKDKYLQNRKIQCQARELIAPKPCQHSALCQCRINHWKCRVTHCEEKLSLHFGFDSFILCSWVLCLYTYLYTMCMPGDLEVRRGHQFPWNWSYRQLSAAIWVLGPLQGQVLLTLTNLACPFTSSFNPSWPEKI